MDLSCSVYMSITSDLRSALFSFLPIKKILESLLMEIIPHFLKKAGTSFVNTCFPLDPVYILYIIYVVSRSCEYDCENIHEIFKALLNFMYIHVEVLLNSNHEM